MNNRLGVGLFFLSILTVSNTHAANVSTELNVGLVSLSGEIVPGDALNVRQAIDEAVSGGAPIKSIRLNSKGGNVRESVTVLRTIRSAGLATIVGKGDTCASSCFLIFAAGKSKVVYSKARIGVHAASEDGQWKTERALRANRAVIRIAHLLNVPSAVRYKMRSTPPSEMAWLGRNELREMQTTFR